MTKDRLQKLFEQYQCRELAWKGKCHDCGAPTEVVVRVEDDGELKVWGGAVIETEADGTFVKCEKCFEAKDWLTEYHPVETYSRIVGYLRPIQQWNPGKKAEFDQRKDFNRESGM